MAAAARCSGRVVAEPIADGLARSLWRGAKSKNCDQLGTRVAFEPAMSLITGPSWARAAWRSSPSPPVAFRDPGRYCEASALALVLGHIRTMVSSTTVQPCGCRRKMAGLAGTERVALKSSCSMIPQLSARGATEESRASSYSCSAQEHFPPRLLTAKQAARYLAYKSTAALKKVPIQPIHLVEVGPGCAPKYDRHAIDRWLDGLSGLAEPPTPHSASPKNEADDALRAWEVRREARRA